MAHRLYICPPCAVFRCREPSGSLNDGSMVSLMSTSSTQLNTIATHSATASSPHTSDAQAGLSPMGSAGKQHDAECHYRGHVQAVGALCTGSRPHNLQCMHLDVCRRGATPANTAEAARFPGGVCSGGRGAAAAAAAAARSAAGLGADTLAAPRPAVPARPASCRVAGILDHCVRARRQRRGAVGSAAVPRVAGGACISNGRAPAAAAPVVI